MKKLFTIFALGALFFSMNGVSARIGRYTMLKVTGKVVIADSSPIEYATVVLLSADGSQAAGTVSGEGGVFELSAPQGTYSLTASYMGYDDASRTIVLTADTEVEPLVLAESATQIETLTVKGQLITREADRFVMNVAESPLSTGRDTYEMLSLAPGVWVKDEDIKINGKSGAKIYINEREVRMSGTELMNYLKAIPAENLQKIEVYPMAGADQDADNAGGIIKITIRRQRDDGVSGSVSFNGRKGWYDNFNYGPSFNINYNRGRLNLYGNGSLWGSEVGYMSHHAKEDTFYENKSEIHSTITSGGDYVGTGAMAGAVLDIDGRNSIGAEYNFWKQLRSTENTRSYSDFIAGNSKTSNDSYYAQDDGGYNQGLTFNYIHKLDTIGSTFKFIGDIAQNISDGRNDYSNSASNYIGDVQQGEPHDSLYYNTAESDYRIYTLTAGIEQILTPTSVLKYGAKFTLADTYSQSHYYGKNAATGEWEDQSNYDRTTDYNEYISALYGSYSKRFKGGISVVAGLRGEYTYIPKLNRKYFGIFPNASLMVPLTSDQRFSLAAAYSRKISRPSFWAMNPLRTQLSEYSYQIGNPNLKPMYVNDLSLTAILGGKYSLSGGVQLIKDQVTQICVVDPDDSNVLVYYFENIKRNNQYYVSLNAPINITDWWMLNINATAVSLNQVIYDDSPELRMWCGFAYAASTFTLPHKWSIDVEGYYQSDVMSGNLKGLSTWNMDVKVKKRLFKDKLTVSVGVDNIFDTSAQTIISEMPNSFRKVLTQPDTQRLRLRLSVSYNFQAGKMFRSKSVESGAADEKGRLSGGGSK